MGVMRGMGVMGVWANPIWGANAHTGFGTPTITQAFDFSPVSGSIPLFHGISRDRQSVTEWADVTFGFQQQNGRQKAPPYFPGEPDPRH
jgi:hypothetical protein